MHVHVLYIVAVVLVQHHACTYTVHIYSGSVGHYSFFASTGQNQTDHITCYTVWRRAELKYAKPRFSVTVLQAQR